VGSWHERGGRFGQIADAVLDVTVLDTVGLCIGSPARKPVSATGTRSLDGRIVLGATLGLRPEGAVAVRKRYDEIWEYKRASQPLATVAPVACLRIPRVIVPGG
jgi:hypothetical protein